MPVGCKFRFCIVDISHLLSEENAAGFKAAVEQRNAQIAALKEIQKAEEEEILNDYKLRQEQQQNQRLTTTPVPEPKPIVNQTDFPALGGASQNTMKRQTPWGNPEVVKTKLTVPIWAPCINFER